MSRKITKGKRVVPQEVVTYKIEKYYCDICKKEIEKDDIYYCDICGHTHKTTYCENCVVFDDIVEEFRYSDFIENLDNVIINLDCICKNHYELIKPEIKKIKSNANKCYAISNNTEELIKQINQKLKDVKKKRKVNNAHILRNER